MWAIPTGISLAFFFKKKTQVKSPSICSLIPNSVRIRQSGRAGNRGVTRHSGLAGLKDRYTLVVSEPRFRRFWKKDFENSI